MATCLDVLQNGMVVVAYGKKHVPISSAQYRANGYTLALEKLVAKSPTLTVQPVFLKSHATG